MKPRHIQLSTVIASNIRAMLAKRGKDMGHLAQVLGITRQMVQGILDGKYVLTMPDAVKISRYLKCPLEKLLEND